ncbi:MAG: cytidine deaminase [Gemmatimonadetes bacterium]|nr:cytidine deaminase [Gemmatimonadota bacterium]MBT8402764.1 cytidine deaminase [Gemmatimonadota bacterium]NNK64619.1 cytidine deaminase [Gemmatimonadota bacterium]
MTTDDELLDRAREIRGRAYAPYSNYPVGAVLEAADGSLYEGCNVENASFPVTLCAERGALSAAVAAGHRSFRRIALSTSGAEAVAPCGACRQALVEFAPNLEIVSEAGEDVRRWSLNELLPVRFVLDPRERRGAAPDNGETTV